jgi:hypothetical protein
VSNVMAGLVRNVLRCARGRARIVQVLDVLTAALELELSLSSWQGPHLIGRRKL